MRIKTEISILSFRALISRPTVSGTLRMRVDRRRRTSSPFFVGSPLEFDRPLCNTKLCRWKAASINAGVEYPAFIAKGLSERTPLPIPGNAYKPQGQQTKGPKVRHNQWRYVDYDGDGLLDLVNGVEDWSFYGWDDAWNERGEWTNGNLHGFVFVYRNEGTNAMPQYGTPQQVHADQRPVDVFGCPSPNFVDFDGDGDLDLLCGEFLDSFTYFENTGSRTSPLYAAGKRLLDAEGSVLRMDLEMIVPVAFDWDLDGDIDLIVGDEDGRVALVENVGGQPAASAGLSPRFAKPRYFQQEADTLKCGALASPYPFDWDADGDIDILSGNTAGYIEWFENLSGKGVSNPKWNAPRKLHVDGKPFRVMAGNNGSIQGPAEAKWGYTTLNVADWNGDGLPDIVFNSIWGKVQWLENVGSLKEPKLKGPQPIEVQGEFALRKPKWTWWNPSGNELVTQWRTTPVVVDLNRDGLLDLCMLDPEGYFSFWERFRSGDRMALRPPRRILCDEEGRPLRLNEKSGGGSGRRKLALLDWDGDGTLDLLLNSSNADLYLGMGWSEGTYRFRKSGTLAKQNIEGHDVSPASVDFEGDGVPDFLGGAEDGRLYYMRHPPTNQR